MVWGIRRGSLPRGHPLSGLVSPDQIALPDFNAGAMENWGLVTYRESALLFDPLSSSSGNKERVVTVIAHELAHQVALTSWGMRKKQGPLEGDGTSPALPLAAEKGRGSHVAREQGGSQGCQ